MFKLFKNRKQKQFNSKIQTQIDLIEEFQTTLKLFQKDLNEKTQWKHKQSVLEGRIARNQEYYYLKKVELKSKLGQ